MLKDSLNLFIIIFVAFAYKYFVIFLGMMYIWPLFHPCVPVLKRELLFSGPFGIFCWLSGCIFVDRFNSEKARDILNMKVKEMKEQKVSTCICLLVTLSYNIYIYNNII